MIFLKQLAMLLSADISITQSCLLLANTQPPSSLQRRLSHAIYRDLAKGMSLYDSLKKYPAYFDNCTCQLTKIGEQTGKLEKMLLLAAHYHEAADYFKQQIKQAIRYPAIVAGIALILTLGMLLFIIPQFEKLFHDLKAPLPWITSTIFRCSFFLRHDGVWVGLLLMGGISALYIHRKKDMQQAGWHDLLKLSGLRILFDEMAMTRFIHQLSIILSAGIPIHHAFILLKQSTTHPPLKGIVGRVGRAIQTGSSLYSAMVPHAYFPPLLLQMVRIGEESGKLENTLKHLVGMREAEMTHRLAQLHKALEPLIMVVVGALIGGLVIGMYLPLFQLGSAF
jgi:type IV pilus assembly protein PilC